MWYYSTSAATVVWRNVLLGPFRSHCAQYDVLWDLLYFLLNHTPDVNLPELMRSHNALVDGQDAWDFG